MQRSLGKRMRWLVALALASASISGTGCVRAISTINYAINGPPQAPAQFGQLEEKRVAVICVSQADLYGAGGAARAIARSVESRLATHVEKIDLAGQEAIDEWMDHHDWNQLDFQQIGQGVRADYVLAVELNSPITLKEGPTLYKGRADVTVTVYDMKQGGKPVFRRHTPEFSWPGSGKYGISETAFERLFLAKLSEYVARYFHPYDPHAEIGGDTVSAS